MRQFTDELASPAGSCIDVEGFGPHALRASAATNALKHNADIAKVQEWLGHANISTARAYGRHHLRPKTVQPSKSLTNGKLTANIHQLFLHLNAT